MLGIISYKDLRSWDNWWPGTSTSAHNWYIILLGNMYTIIQQRILVNGWKKWMTLQTEAAASTRIKSQINASLKKLLKSFNMNASKLPVIDTMKDENKDSYYTTILKPENIDIPEELNDTSLCQND